MMDSWFESVSSKELSQDEFVLFFSDVTVRQLYPSISTFFF